MSVTLHIWVTIHHLIVFLLHKFKMMTSPDAFFIFSKFSFSGLLEMGGEGGGGLKGKKWPKMTKIICFTPYLRKCTSYDCGFWYTCVKYDISSNFFSFFQNSDFLDFSKFINKCQKEILRCAPPSSYVFDFFFNWDSLHASLNSHYKALSYKKKKHKKIKASRKSLYKEPTVNSCLLILDLKRIQSLF